MLDKEQQLFRSQPVTSVCKHAWRRAEQMFTSNGCRRCRQVAAFRNTCDIGVQVVVFTPPVARCWKLAAVDWSYGDESLDLHLHRVPLTGIRLSRREKLVETGVKYRRRVRLCVVNTLVFRRWSRLLLGLAINECQISTLGLSLLVHTPAIPANVYPADQLDHHAACGQWDAFDVCSDVSPPLRTFAWHNAVRNTGLILFSRSVNESRLLASLAESDYCWLLSHSVSAEIRIPIYRIRRYASAVNEYSPIYDIGLTLQRTVKSSTASISKVHVHFGRHVQSTQCKADAARR